MEVKPGYKQTEVGVIPDEWTVTSFSGCADLHHGFQFREEHFSDSGIVVTKIGNLIDGGGLDFERGTYIPEARFDQFARYALTEGDVLMALTGATLGKVSVVDFKGRTLQNYRVGKFTSKSVSTEEYVFRLLQSSFIQGTIKKLVNEAAQPNLGKRDFNKFIVPLPNTLVEQHAIATALSDVDGLLGGLDRLIAKKRGLKQAAMQQLLTGQTRLPGFHGDWPVKELKSLYAKVFNKSPMSSADGHTLGAYPLFVSGGVAKRIDHALFKNTEALIVSDGGVFDVKYFSGDFSVTDHCFVISLIGDMRFYFQWMSLRKAELDLMAFKGSGLRNLDKPTFGNLGVAVPQPAEQTAIAEVLTEMDAELAALEQRREKTRALKQAMMQELLTGKTRLI